MFLQDSHLFFQFFFSPQVVAVKKCDPLAFCLTNPMISCSCCTFILYILNNPDSAVFLYEFLHAVIGIIPGAVIKDEQFPVLHGLCKYTIYSFLQIFFAIVSRGDDRYRRHKFPFLTGLLFHSAEELFSYSLNFSSL